MKKYTKLIFTALILTIGLNIDAQKVKAAEKIITNHNGIIITQQEYRNLKNLGFDDLEIMTMEKKEFDANKDLIGEVVATKIEKDYIISGAKGPGTVTTTYKTMTTTISKVGNYYRYKVNMSWNQIPSKRSYDIIAIGFDSNVKYSSNLTFRQTYCYSPNNCSSSTSFSSNYSSNTGIGVVFKLPSSTLSSLSSYLYFDVAKNTSSTITSLNAYGDYSHATKTISEANAKKYTVNQAIILNNSISSYYDSISTARATWSGTW